MGYSSEDRESLIEKNTDNLKNLINIYIDLFFDSIFKHESDLSAEQFRSFKEKVVNKLLTNLGNKFWIYAKQNIQNDIVDFQMWDFLKETGLFDIGYDAKQNFKLPKLLLKDLRDSLIGYIKSKNDSQKLENEETQS